MAHQSELISENIENYLIEHENKEILKFITCGSVDDGKSTLIGRLLYDSKMIFEDQLASLEKDSKKVGTTGNEIDLALLVDGLQSEREQGITIDVAYRFFSTDKRKFIIADTPGHEQYTRNMVTGASSADLAIILIDAKEGVLTQTKRHSFIVSLLGIKNIIVAINKMDLLGFSEAKFEEIKKEYQKIIPHLSNYENINFIYIPISALHGDNIVHKSNNTPWYTSMTLMNLLNTIDFTNTNELSSDNFMFQVQYINRPHQNFRGFAGTIASGRIKVADEILVLPSKKRSKIKSIVTPDIKELRAKTDNEEVETHTEAYAPMAITLTLEDEIDISRGDMIVNSKATYEMANSIKATIVWMDETPMKPYNSYIIKKGTSVVNGKFSSKIFRHDINTFEKIDSDRLMLNDIATCTIKLDEKIAINTYSSNRYTGSFIVINRYTNNTVGAGMIHETVNEKELSDYSQYDKELNAYVRKHYPAWECKEIM